MHHSITRWIPVFTDVATDPFNPPEIYVTDREGVRASSVYEYPEHKAALQRFIYGELKALEVQLTASTVFEICQKVATENFGWEYIYGNVENSTVQLIATTPVFGFKDDVCIEVRSKGSGKGCEVHVRSRSRVGISDLGTNARRIRNFLKVIAREVKSM